MKTETICDSTRNRHATGIIGADAVLTLKVLKAIVERDKMKQAAREGGRWLRIKTMFNPLKWNR